MSARWARATAAGSALIRRSRWRRRARVGGGLLRFRSPDTTRDTGRGHGRREIRTLKIMSVSTGIDFPHASQAIQIRRRRHRLDQPKRFTTETVYAITNLHVHQARPAQLAAWIRGHWHIENQIHWVRDVTCEEGRFQIRTGTGPHVMAALRNATIGALRITSPASPTSPPPTATTPRQHPTTGPPRHHLTTLPGALGVHRTAQGSKRSFHLVSRRWQMRAAAIPTKVRKCSDFRS
ncbi:ISAs1 family transposase [Streptomyces alanosinicus]|uniref:ISAs1 family transposase n=1 Tax=Streptomyces alanosinicus TaxID=68171 RepID=UPI00227D98FB|nr:ISAs1 family transposase [Streptomyces alanosinicus]